jgi:pimeloyl-ACP methyl ester carboxylesterase
MLNSEPVTANGAEPRQWLFMLHGIYGAGRNWGSVARRLVRSRPEWGARLIDVREHGASQGFTGPHTLEAAAQDLDRLAAATAHPAAVLGHSFGGKVALVWARTRPKHLRQVWVIDSTPAAGAPTGTAWRMLDVLERVRGPFPSRDVAVAALGEHGIDETVALWMVTNLETAGSGMRWRFELDAMRELLVDFFDADLWDVVETPPPGMEIHFVRALEASTMTAEALDRIRQTARNGRVHLHEVESGHWINADNPDALHALLVERLAAAA